MLVNSWDTTYNVGWAYCGTSQLIHWGRVTHICVSELTVTGSDNGLSHGQRQAIIWTNAGILLIRTLGTNCSDILGEIHSFSFSKMHVKMSSAKWRLFGLVLNELGSGLISSYQLLIKSCLAIKDGKVEFSRTGVADLSPIVTRRSWFCEWFFVAILVIRTNLFLFEDIKLQSSSLFMIKDHMRWLHLCVLSSGVAPRFELAITEVDLNSEGTSHDGLYCWYNYNGVSQNILFWPEVCKTGPRGGVWRVIHGLHNIRSYMDKPLPAIHK